MKKPLTTTLILSATLLAVLLLLRPYSPHRPPKTLPGGIFVGSLPEIGDVILSCWQLDDTLSGAILRTTTPGRMPLEGRAPRTGKFGLTFHPDADGDEATAWRLVGDTLQDPDLLTGILSIPGSKHDYPVSLSRIGSYSAIHAKSGIRVFGRGLTRNYHAAVPSLHQNHPAEAMVSSLFLAKAKGLAADFTDTTMSEIWDSARYGFQSEYESWDEFELAGIGPGWISVRWMSYQYTGGAHGNWGITGLNWQLDPFRPTPIELHHLFREDSPWVELLSTLCIESLKTQGASSVVDNSIASFAAADLNSFTLHQHGLEIHFNPYSVASYAEGAFTVSIPWETVAHLRPPHPVIP
ncbi:MAG: hypothetical protein RI897_853 [Verrucomicrobiota bacterium]